MAYVDRFESKGKMPEALKLQTRSLPMVLVFGLAVVFRSLLPAQDEQKPRAAESSKSSTSRDLSGIWMERDNEVTFSAKEPPMQPWAAEAYKNAKPSLRPSWSPDSKDPILSCLPPGVPRILLIPFPMQIIQTPGDVFMIFEYDHYVRQIYTNRTHHSRDLDPSWMGDSIGQWDGDTFVVDTVGLNDKSWLDQVGHLIPLRCT